MNRIFSAKSTNSAATPWQLSRRNRRTSRLARSTVLPPALLCVAIFAASCSGGTPSPSATANADISRGLADKSSGHTQQAIADFNAAVAANPTDPVPYYDLGVMYQQIKNNPAQAVVEYNKAILANPNYRPALFNLAILDTTNNPQAAISLYQQLLRIHANDANVLFNLGLLLHAQGQAAQGQADVQKAVFINPALKSRIPANSGITP